MVYEDGHADERRGVNTCGVDNISFGAVGPQPGTPPVAGNPAHDPSFRIVNRGRRDVDEVYARVAGSTRWGADRLGNATVDADSYHVVQLPAGQCMWGHPPGVRQRTRPGAAPDQLVRRDGLPGRLNR